MAKKKTNTSLFSGAHHQNIQGAEFRTAGNDMITSSINISLGTGAVTLSVATGPTDSNLTPDKSNPKERRCSFFQQAFRFFRSPEFRNALMHQPAATERAELAPIELPAPTPTTQQGSTSATVNAGREGTETQLPNEDKEDDFNVTTLSNLDLGSMPGQEITNAEIYVRGMLRCGRGLACWHPRPPFAGERGIVPGDVGTFDLTDGFQKIFNIWEDSGLLAVPGIEREQLPPKKITSHPGLRVGDTIVTGGSATVKESKDGCPKLFKFHCEFKQGAILACTAAADLEKLDDPIALRDFLVKHAGVVYQHANSIRRIADEDSLYIVSGCIKTDSWALAAWHDVPKASHDIMKLVRKRSKNDADQVSSYRWTDRGTAEVQSGPTFAPATAKPHQRNDQCLFLRGFKLSLSKDFRLRLNKPSLNPTSGSRGGGHDSRFSDSYRDPERRHSRNANPGGNEGGRGNPSSSTLPSSGEKYSLASGIQIDSLIPVSGKSFHPCDKIANLLLEMTGAECALSHDDDWRLSSLDDTTVWDVDSCIDLLQSRTTCVRNGVAYLLFKDEQLPQSLAVASVGEDLVQSQDISITPSISAASVPHSTPKKAGKLPVDLDVQNITQSSEIGACRDRCIDQPARDDGIPSAGAFEQAGTIVTTSSSTAGRDASRSLQPRPASPAAPTVSANETPAHPLDRYEFVTGGKEYLTQENKRLANNSTISGSAASGPNKLDDDPQKPSNTLTSPNPDDPASLQRKIRMPMVIQPIPPFKGNTPYSAAPQPRGPGASGPSMPPKHVSANYIPNSLNHPWQYSQRQGRVSPSMIPSQSPPD